MIVNTVSLFEVLRQLLIEFANLVGFIGSVLFNRASYTRAISCPCLLTRVLRPHKEYKVVFFMVWRQNRHGIRFIEPGKVVKITILPIRVLNIIMHHGYRGTAKDGGTRTNALHDCFASLSEFFLHVDSCQCVMFF